MENLLNAAWLLLSLAAGWLWLRRWRDISRFSFPVQLCALACSLIILFPVVSANDDLYLQQIAIETSDKQKSSTVTFSGKLARQCSHPSAASFAMPQTPPTAYCDAVLAMVATAVVSLLTTTISFLPFLDRPPPRLFLA